MDRAIASQVINLETALAQEDGMSPSDIWEEAMLYAEKAEKAFAKGKSDLALKHVFHVASSMVYPLERSHFSGVEEAS